MNTKQSLLKLVLDAQSDNDDCVNELFFLVHQAIERTEVEEIGWYVSNGLLESDVLLFILLNDIDLSVNFRETVIIETVHGLCRLPKLG